MTPLTTQGSRAEGRDRLTVILAGAFLVLAALAAYHNSFTGPFLFDDRPSIVDNSTIRRLWLITDALSPPRDEGQTVSGRPVLNLSFALNYAISGTSVWSYHALNLAIHVLAGLVLFGVVRRTLKGAGRKEQGAGEVSLLPPAPCPMLLGNEATFVAFVAALLWTLHPLQTESVTYVVQRAESLMGLFCLLTLYCFIRGTESPKPGAWHGLAVVACLAGMATKEVMVSAPLMVWVYDRTFVSGGFVAAWRRHRRLYLGLAATWLLLLYLVTTTGGNRGGSVGFGVNASWWAYALTQFQAIARYLRLAVFPQPLVFEYGTFWVKRTADVAPYALVVVPLLAAAVLGMRHRPTFGLLGAWFFVLLAPTSLMPGTTQMIVEHRMYLPLAAVVALTVTGIHAVAGARSLAAFFVLAVSFGWLTGQRNNDYRSELALWRDTVAKCPTNASAWNNMGYALFNLGQDDDAIGCYDEALRVDPAYAVAYYNLGSTLDHLGRLPEAIGRYREAVRLKPRFAEAHYNLGAALDRRGELTEAIEHYEEAVRIRPRFAAAHNNLGNALARSDRASEAIAHFKECLRLQPEYAEAHNNLGNALLRLERPSEAIAEFAHALRLKPDYVDARFNLGNVLAQTGRVAGAIRAYQEVLRLQPGHAGALTNLGNVLLSANRATDAIDYYAQALRLEPDQAEAHYNLGNALLQAGRASEAVEHFQTALRLSPAFGPAREALVQLQISP